MIVAAGHLHSRVGASLVGARALSRPSSAEQGILLEPLQAEMLPFMAVLLATSDRQALMLPVKTVKKS